MKTFLKISAGLVLLLVGYELVHLLWLRDAEGWALLSWMEAVPEDGPSSQAEPQDVGAFEKVIAFEGERSSPVTDFLAVASLGVVAIAAWVLWGSDVPSFRKRPWRAAFYAGGLSFSGLVGAGLLGMTGQRQEVSDDAWNTLLSQVKVGDVIAYRKEKWSARRELFAEGKLTVIGYRLFRYGHLAIVVEDPDNAGKKVLFTSQSRKGVNADEDLNTLRSHNWDAYRLDKPHRLDLKRLRAGVRRCMNRAGHFFGYDFTGMFALWNEDLKPESLRDFGAEYICSTSVVTLLYFAGFESDSTPRQGMDLVTPYQVVRAKGRFIKPPPLPGEQPE